MEVDCEHQNENLQVRLVTVSRLDNQKKIRIICERCYHNLRDEDEREFELMNPVLYETTCLLCCGTHSVRYHADLEMNICDTCKMQCVNLLSHAETIRIPPTTVIPDEVAPFVFIGCKDAAFNLNGLLERNIKRILICCDHLPASHYSHDHPNLLLYHRIPIKDSLTQELEVWQLSVSII
jgi:hypothetical protein